ncbi:cytochrome P450 [Xylogone sp. PMI_703]|nr:cytochrome P450 [Xylogone sp. PMI_703]
MARFDFDCSNDGTCNVGGYYDIMCDVNSDLGGSINETIAADYFTLVQSCLDNKVTIFLIDIHNYTCWNREIIGQGGPTNAQFASVRRQRVGMGVGRDDFLDGLIKSGMGFEELQLNAGLLFIAGNETTATLLTGAVFLLIMHPEVLEKLALEVRVINESFRCYPAVASGAQRIVPSGGAEVVGYTIPEGTVVAVWQ